MFQDIRTNNKTCFNSFKYSHLYPSIVYLHGKFKKFSDHFPIIEMKFFTFDFLISFMSFPSNQDNIFFALAVNIGLLVIVSGDGIKEQLAEMPLTYVL